MVDEAVEAGLGADGSPDGSGTSAQPRTSDFYDAAEWTQVLVGIGERFRSRVDGNVLQALLTEMLAAHTEFAAAATADRVRHEATRAAAPIGGGLDDKLSRLQSAVGDLETSYGVAGPTDGEQAAEVAQATRQAAEEEKAALLAGARAEADLVREQAVVMADSMIAAAADEADRRLRAHDEAIAEGRVASEAEAVRVLEDALADADFIRTSAEEARVRIIADAEAGAEALRRAVVEEIAAPRAPGEAVEFEDPAGTDPEASSTEPEATDEVEPEDGAEPDSAEPHGSADVATGNDGGRRSWRRGFYRRRGADDEAVRGRPTDAEGSRIDEVPSEGDAPSG